MHILVGQTKKERMHILVGQMEYYLSVASNVIAMTRVLGQSGLIISTRGVENKFYNSET